MRWLGGCELWRQICNANCYRCSQKVWALSPDVRLGQLFAHLGFLGEAHLGRGLGDIDDDELLSVLYRHRDELLARSQTPSDHPLQQTPVGSLIPGSP